jgi:molybdate transport system substrate-binding protein
MTLRRLLSAVCAGALALAWAVPAPAAELVVSAAASLTNAFRDIGKRFEAAHPGDTVVFNFAASDVLLAQIDKGAPVDAFASADEDTMDRAARSKRIVAATRRDFAVNRLVIIVPKGAPAVPSVDALKASPVRRIAIGSPESVPAGRYARDALQTANAWSALEPKLVRAQNVRQVLDYVARGEVDAGFVYNTDAAIMLDRVTVAANVAVPRPVTYPIAVVAESRQQPLAAAFVEFVAGPEGRAVLERYGFGASVP